MGFPRRPALRPYRRPVAALTLVLFLLQAVSPGPLFAQQIVIDGRTQTVLDVRGNVTDITTSTIVGPHALNSFEHFNVAPGHVVNLHVPGEASNLFNLVHASQSRIDGMLNSIQNGQVGGNVFFLNPYGVVVGREGVVNVGSLSVVTPTPEFMEGFFAPGGSPDAAAISAVLEGTVPIRESGLIVVEGRVNAIGDIRMTSGSVTNDGQILSGAAFFGVNVDFSDVVNVNGLALGGRIAVEPGRIAIEAVGDLTNRGVIAADGADFVDAGEITLTAGGDIVIGPGGLVSARGRGEASSGGRIVSFAGGNALLDSGARLDAGGGEISGDGGFVEFSAAHAVTLRGALSASAVQGSPGRILIDPEDILVEADQFQNGEKYEAIADRSVVIADGVTISTRKLADGETDHLNAPSVGDSGPIIIQAPSIKIGKGARLLAHAVNEGGTSYAGGDITLTADMSDHSVLRPAEAGTKIEIDGALLKGESISLTATTTASYHYEDTDENPGNPFLTTVSGLGALLAGVNVAVAKATGTSEIVIKSGSTLEAAGAVSMTATTTAKSGTMTMAVNLRNTNPVSLSFVYGELGATATVDVQGGATIKADSLTVAANNSATLDVNAYAITPFGQSNTIGDAAVAVSDAEATSTATIGAGAVIDVAGDVSVSAFNENSFATNSTAMGLGGAAAGIAATIYNATTRAEASVSTDLVGVGNVTIEALDKITRNRATASGAAGSSFIVKTALGGLTQAGNWVREKFASSVPDLDSRSGATEKPKIAGAVTIADTDHVALAYIGDNVDVDSGGAVVVAAKVEDARLQNHALSSTESTTNGDETNPTATISLSAAVGYGNYTHDAKAYIASGANVTAQRVGITSDTLVPYDILFHKWEGPSTIFSKLNSNLGIGNGFLTGFANATENTGQFGIAGSVSFLDFTNTSTAYLGRNAVVTIVPGAAPSATITLPSRDTRSFEAPVAILAKSLVEGVYASGNVSLALNGVGGDPGAKSAGGSYGHVIYDTTTRAFIAEGARVTEQTGEDPVAVDVVASTRSMVLAIDPSAGRGASWGLSGIFQYVNIDDKTSASVDDEADVRASTLNVKAAEDVLSVAATGAFYMSDSVGVGLSVAINDVTTDTEAFVGNNDTYLADGSQLSLTNGKVTATGIDVGARTDGRIETVTVGAAVVNAGDPSSGFGITDKVKGAVVRILDKLPEVFQKIEAGPANKPNEPRFGIAFSGSSSVNLVDLDTVAYVTGATLSLSGSGSTVALSAVNDTDIGAVSGAGALTRMNNPSSNFSAGAAGSIAVNRLGNDTLAYFDHATVTHAEDVAAQALAGGEQFAVAVGLAVNISTDQSKAGTAAGSVSVSESTNTVSAYAKNSTITGAAGAATPDFGLVAYDRTYLGTGGGSLSGGGKGGFGAAVTYSEIANTVSAYVESSTVSNFQNVGVRALTSARIGAGGGMVGVTVTDNSGTLGGAVVFSDIDNVTFAEIRAASAVTASGSVEVIARDIPSNDAAVQPLSDVIDAEDVDPDDPVEPVEPAGPVLDYEGAEAGVASGGGSGIISVAGVVQGGKNNVGVSFAWNSIDNSFNARILDSQVRSDGTLSVQAESSATIIGLAVGAGVALGQFAGAGSVVVNEITNDVVAEVTSPSNRAVTASALEVSAKDTSRIDSLSGQVTISTGNASIGAAIAHNEIGNTVKARLERIDLGQTGSTHIGATNDSRIRTLSASGGGSQNFAFNGSASSSHITNTTEAEIVASKANNQVSTVEVKSLDTSVIQALSGSVALAGGGAVGAAVAVNRVDNTTSARVRDSAAVSTYNVGNLLVLSKSKATISSVAVGVGGSLKVGVAGSIATNFIDSDTVSSIDSGAAVIAQNNVGVIAESDDVITNSAGAAGVGIGIAGVGASVAVNVIGGETKAQIVNTCHLASCSSAFTRVTALGQDPTKKLAVSTGELNGEVDLGSGLDLASYNRTDLAAMRRTEELTGLAVNASATHSIENISANVAGGQYAGVAATVNVNKIGGETAALIDGAVINPSGLSGSAQAVSVKAGDHAYGNNFVGTVAIGPFGAGVGMGADTNVFERNTRAILDARNDVRAVGAIVVDAQSSQGASSLTVSGGGGAVGVIGAGTIAKFTGTTEAILRNTVAYTKDVTVNARHDSRLFVAAGGGTIGLVGIAASAAVALDQSTTRAYMDNANLQNVSGAVNVNASSGTEMESWAVSGSAGAGVLVAGNAIVSIVKNTTEAFLKASQIGTSASRAASVNIAASDKVKITNRSGALGVDLSFVGGGVGLAAAVSSVQNTTLAYADSSGIYTSGSATITADAERDLETVTASLGVGGAGFGGAAGVILVGSELSGDVADELYDNSGTSAGGDGILSRVDEVSSSDRLVATADGEVDNRNVQTGVGISEDELAALNDSGKVDVSAALNSAGPNTRTAALVAGGTIVRAGTDVRVAATEKVETSIDAGAGGLGGLAAGGAVGVANLHHNVEAAVLGQASLTSETGNISITAEAGRLNASEEAAHVGSYQGAAGVVALGAAVSVANVTSNVRAIAERGTTLDILSGPGDISVEAKDSLDISTEAWGFTLGLAAAGAVVARSEKEGESVARISDQEASGIETFVDVATGKLRIASERTGGVSASTVAGAGGIFGAGSGSDARASDTGTVTALLGNQVNATAAAAEVEIAATARPKVYANAYGVVASSIVVGASIAHAKATPTVSATFGTGSTLVARELTVNATVDKDEENPTAHSDATASAGVGLIGGTGAESLAESVSTVTASIGSRLSVSGDVSVTANNTTLQKAVGSGKIAGFIAGGAILSDANADSTTTAEVTNAATGLIGGKLNVYATGSDETTAESTLGHGGGLTVAGARAKTSNQSETTATVGGGNFQTGYDCNAFLPTACLVAGKIDVSAGHTATFNGKVNSILGALLGLSGAYTSHDIESKVTAGIADHARLKTYDIDVSATNAVNKPWLSDEEYNATAGSGGVINGSASESTSTIVLTTSAVLGTSAVLFVDGDMEDPGRTNFSAGNKVEVYDRAKLDAGGAIPLARAESKIDVDADASVDIGAGVLLDTVGTLNLSARTDATVETQANAKTYGIASAAEGESNSTIRTDNTISIGGGAWIRADGDINAFAGADAQGSVNQLSAVATTDLFNKTAAPIVTDPEADALIEQKNTISIASGALVRSRRDITLRALEGSASADGQGTGKDLYRELASEVASAFSNLVGEGDVSLDIKAGSSTSNVETSVTVDGTVHAGIYNRQRLVLGTNFSTSGGPEEQTDGVTYYLTTEDLVTNMFDLLERLVELRNRYANDPTASAAYDAEINFLRNQLVRLGYADVAPNGDIYPVKNLTITVINVNEVRARGGDIRVDAGVLSGNGSLLAPNDTEITIINNSPFFLRTNELTIEDVGGHLFFNGVAVSSAAEIDARNRSGAPKANLQVTALGSSDAVPQITVQNTLNPLDMEAQPPDIELTGDITNRTGLVTIINNHGSVKLQSASNRAAPSIVAETVEIFAPNGNIEQEYVDGLQSIGGDPSSLWDDIASAAEGNTGTVTNDEFRPGKGSWIAGNSVFLAARYLNLNGVVQSGIRDWQVTLGPELNERINQFYQDWVKAGRPSISGPGDLAPYQLTGFIDPDPTKRSPLGEVAAYFNPETGQIVLDGVQVQGGYAELYGEILNTGGGVIKILDGYGRINVNNQTGRPLLIYGLDNGDDIEGVLRITDTAKRTASGVPITTVYERIGTNVRVQQWAGGEILSESTLGSTRNASYQPQVGLRYVWTRGQDFTERWIGTAWQDEWFDFVPTKEGDYDTWEEEPKGGVEFLPEGEYTVSATGPNYRYTFSEYETAELEKVGEPLRWSECNSFNVFGWCVGKRTYYIQETWEGGKKEVYTHSVKADFPIQIEFIGYDAGERDAAINVVSNADILLAGPVRNTGGQVVLRTDEQIRQVSERAAVTGRTVQLDAQSGIGTELMPIAVQLAGDAGFLTARTDAFDVFLTSPSGDVRIVEIATGGGNVRLEADGNIVQWLPGGGPVVTGNRIDLVSRSGGIGTAAQPLNVQAGDDQLAGVNASALGDISLRQTSGDLHLIQVKSLDGDVRLEVVGGSLVDANPNQRKDTRTIAELERLWDMMLLTGAGAEESANNTLTAYRNMKESEYRTYWYLRGVRPSEYDADGNVIAYEWDPYDPGAISDPQLRSEYERLHEAYGSTTFDPNWTYVLTDEEISTLTDGAEWTENELKYALSGGILFKQTTSTETRLEEPNVIGRNVTLLALAGSVGTDNGEIVIDGTDPDALKNDDARIALAAAEVDDVAVDNENLKITVLLRDSIDVAATGEIVAEGRDHVYLGSRVPIYVNTIESGGSIRVKGTDGLYSVATSGPAHIQGGRTILEGGDGGIGTSSAPLKLDLQPDAALTARAAQEIHIAEVSGDLNLAEIFGESLVYLTAATGSILDDRGARPVALEGKSITLLAPMGHIGAAGDPLVFTMGADGTLVAVTAGVGNDIYLRGVSGVVNAGVLSSTGELVLESLGGGLNLNGNVFSSGNMRLAAAGDLVMADGVSVATSWGSSITMAATGNASLRKIESGASIEIGSGGALTLLDAVTAANGVVMSAGGAFTVGAGVAITATDDVELTSDDALAMAEGARITATTGPVLLSAQEDVHVSRIETAGDIGITAGGSILTSAAGDVIHLSGEDITLGAAGGSIGTFAAPVVVMAGGLVNASAHGDIYLEQRGGDLVSEYMLSDTGSIGLVAMDGSVAVQTLSAPGTIAIESLGGMSLGNIDDVAQLNLTMHTPGSELEIDHVTISNGAVLRANTIRVNQLVHDGADPLRVDVAGVSGLADSIAIEARSDTGIIFDRLLADYAVVRGDVDDLAFLHNVIGSIGEFRNRHHDVRVDNVNKALFDVDLQLYAPDLQPFFLIFGANRVILTNAYDVNYDPDYIETQFGTENSFVRITNKMLELVGADSPLTEGGAAFVSPFAGPDTGGGFVEVEEGAVNVGDEDGAADDDESDEEETGEDA